jgi:hypothetical protein
MHLCQAMPGGSSNASNAVASVGHKSLQLKCPHKSGVTNGDKGSCPCTQICRCRHAHHARDRAGCPRIRTKQLTFQA